ncbi:MAG: hypothetical protein A2729_01345 [Candidatus Buchananbacteria bacterium RIFCSPHIGHO2_01_FULL_39_14]|uniref:NTP pyrophosphohydrolase MazG putative catalytic core domain-containing protein n=2 Tax=Candidatus Buchananiibacteriota TaxID=1817903 RepID=A0A1G1YU28_9BACT|nr:MAG: hypothetical protein A2729_01345 [Candidatus Buchananbacteria bacterium RIFCSPHIGHO2_01_FULL_39_14]OGY49209.1 MAG: hypothetical protein A3D39_00370 [Candidatus Buchananbacteria bacterium RIFCSPHIGHO2_02_FULL_39_17]OGY55865.1 MAG: hypothetical protein A2912_02675 [Candidatus Buchananbacteria bacterium RIFCSPLOWO2_01_FULL_40_23b]
MKLNEIQKFCRQLLAKVSYPRIGTIIGLQEELGKLAEEVMNIEIYGKPFDKNKLEKKCSEVFFSFIDLCNSYDVELDQISIDRVNEIKKKINQWEIEHGSILQDKRKKLD